MLKRLINVTKMHQRKMRPLLQLMSLKFRLQKSRKTRLRLSKNSLRRMHLRNQKSQLQTKEQLNLLRLKRPLKVMHSLKLLLLRSRRKMLKLKRKLKAKLTSLMLKWLRRRPLKENLKVQTVMQPLQRAKLKDRPKRRLRRKRSSLLKPLLLNQSLKLSTLRSFQKRSANA